MKHAFAVLAVVAALGLAVPALADDTKPAEDTAPGGGTTTDTARDDSGDAMQTLGDAMHDCGQVMNAIGVLQMAKDCKNKDGD